MKMMTVQEFFKLFPDDKTCLEHLFKTRFGNGKDVTCPKCHETGMFRQLTNLPAYTCNCGHHLHPMVGTPFEHSRTSLQKWFYAMYLFTTSRHGVPAKELQRQLAVTYKCAWRMGHEIRKYMGKVDGDDSLNGHVEVDETVVGGYRKGGKRGRIAPNKTIVLGIIQRGGSVMTKVIANVQKTTLEPHIMNNVKAQSTVSTDELPSYNRLGTLGYTHGVVNHSDEEWVRGIHHTNSIEGFWSQLKRSIKGTHIHVSAKHLSKYLGEFEYRYNLRKTPDLMLSRLLKAF